MNRFRWVAVCIAGAAILIFTQFPYAATMPTRVLRTAAEVNYTGMFKSNAESTLVDATEQFAK